MASADFLSSRETALSEHAETRMDDRLLGAGVDALFSGDDSTRTSICTPFHCQFKKETPDEKNNTL